MNKFNLDNDFINLSDSKIIKKLLLTIDKWKLTIFDDLTLPVYKINSQSCFLIKENSNASIEFSNLFKAFKSAVKRRSINSVRRLSGVEGDFNWSSKIIVPKYYYKDNTFTYLEVNRCLIKLLEFSLSELSNKKQTPVDTEVSYLNAEINKYFMKVKP